MPPPLAHVRLDLGWYPDEHIGMFSGEVRLPSSGELLAMEVHPVAHYPDLSHFLGIAQDWQNGLLRDVFDPDPF